MHLTILFPLLSPITTPRWPESGQWLLPMWMTGNIGWVNSAFDYWMLSMQWQDGVGQQSNPSDGPGGWRVSALDNSLCNHNLISHTHAGAHTRTHRQTHMLQFLLLQVSIQLMTKSTNPTVYHAEVLLNPSEWWKGCWESYQQPLLSKSAVYLKLEIFSVDYKNILKLHYLLVQLDEINYKQSPLDKLFSLTSLISWNIQMKRIWSSRHSHSQAYRFGIGLWESGTNPSNRQLLHVCLNQTPF